MNNDIGMEITINFLASITKKVGEGVGIQSCLHVLSESFSYKKFLTDVFSVCYSATVRIPVQAEGQELL